jgi:HPt (histidine-containing phosphotransfer) domain-containing protein
LSKVIELYLAEAPRLLQALRDASEREDSKALQEAAHSLKSSSANLGVVDLAKLCRELEMEARSGKLEQTRSRLNEIDAAYALIRPTLESLEITRWD